MQKKLILKASPTRIHVDMD